MTQSTYLYLPFSSAIFLRHFPPSASIVICCVHVCSVAYAFASTDVILGTPSPPYSCCGLSLSCSCAAIKSRAPQDTLPLPRKTGSVICPFRCLSYTTPIHAFRHQNRFPMNLP
jgi:hypothetical protein